MHKRSKHGNKKATVRKMILSKKKEDYYYSFLFCNEELKDPVLDDSVYLKDFLEFANVLNREISKTDER